MSIYALADLHLCLSCPEKSMAYVWSAWDNYVSRIQENWEAVVTDEPVAEVAPAMEAAPDTDAE